MSGELKLVEVSESIDLLNSIYKARFPAWGERLQLEQFLDRERLIAKSDWFQSGVKTWGLTTGTGNIVLASCETLPIQIKENDRVLNGCIVASVLVEEHLRNRGYASRLVKEVTQFSLSSLDFVCLFSEVGTPIYERCGFTAQPIHRLTISVKDGTPFTSNSIKPLTKSDCLEQLSKSGCRIKNPILLASSEQIRWKWLRCSFYAETLGRTMPTVLGFAHGDSLLIFAPDFKADTLKILHAARSPQTNDQSWLELWKSAYSIAAQCQFSSIVAWVPTRLMNDLSELRSFFSLDLTQDHEDIPMFYLKNPIPSNIDIEYMSWA